MVSLIILFFCILINTQDKVGAQNIFPISVELSNIKGEKVNSFKFENNKQLVFIDFWHSSCSPCMQMFDAVRDNFEEWNKNTNCKIIAIACQERDEKIIQLIESKKWPVEIYFDPDYKLFKELCKLHDKTDMTYSFPTVFVFDNNWQLLDRQKGAKRKFKNEFRPQKAKISHDDFVIDLDYYYSLCKKWNKD